MNAVAVALDVLGDPHRLWQAWLDDAKRRYRLASADLDAELPNWRALLQRFAEEHAPVYLRPDAEVSAALRRLQASGTRIGIYTEVPLELATVVLEQLGAARRTDLLEAGPNALDGVRERLGSDVAVVESRAQLVGLR